MVAYGLPHNRPVAAVRGARGCELVTRGLLVKATRLGVVRLRGWLATAHPRAGDYGR